MSKKVLCVLNDIDFERIFQHLANLATLDTIKKIYPEFETDERDKKFLITSKRKIEIQINEFWEMVSRKYNIPFYPSGQLHISSEYREVYIEED